jgi:hypothetical protein
MTDRNPRSGLKQDPLVEKIVDDPNHSQTRLVSGYVGKSTRSGYWRVYLNLEFSDYLEIAEADVLHVETLGDEDTSGAWLWLRREASVEHVRSEPQKAQAEFLSGEIAAALLAQASPQAAMGFPWLRFAGLLKTFTVTECATCPTNDGSHSCVPAVCTLATSCLTTVPTDPGCGKKVFAG